MIKFEQRRMLKNIISGRTPLRRSPKKLSCTNYGLKKGVYCGQQRAFSIASRPYGTAATKDVGDLLDPFLSHLLLKANTTQTQDDYSLTNTHQHI